ncbi:MAG: PH domain-containing protein [Planctomycetes bacterium]|nr:PH domain-containing protein [Planctomycetota bacterium]
MTGQADKAAQWMYQGIWGVLVELFKVPREPPALPVSTGHRHDTFQPGPGYLRYMKFKFWVILLLMDIVFSIIWFVLTAVLLKTDHYILAGLLAIPALAIIVLPDIVAYIAIHLRYDTTWYVFTDRSMRLRRGVMVLHEMTITFENVQNVTVDQGPLQRYFGIGSVVVQTAGGASGDPKHGGGSTHQAVIEGIDNPADVRDRIMAQVRASTSAGLGDEHHLPSHSFAGASESLAAPGRGHAPAWTAAHLDALRAIRDELRSLPASA